MRESVSNVERGIHSPQLVTLEKISQVLDIKIKDLFDFDSF